MDRNSIIGLALIGLIIIGYSIYTQPGPEEIEAMRLRRDSIERVAELNKPAPEAVVAGAAIENIQTVSDSALNEAEKLRLGEFAPARQGKEELVTLENNLMKVTLTSKGGKIKTAHLKDFKNYNGQPLSLINGDSSVFNVSFSAQNRIINSGELFFQPFDVRQSTKSKSMRLYAGENRYIEYLYTLKDDSYLVDFKINVVGMQDLIASNASYINVDWQELALSTEKSIENQRAATSVYYRFTDEDVDNISETSDEKESLKAKVKWIAFKQQFFTVALISDNSFDSPVVETMTNEESTTSIKKMSASFSLPFERKAEQSFGMRFYIGPNHYQTLKKIDDLDLEKLIPLGWGIFGWVNRLIVIPTFNYLDSFNLNYGIIILFLTIFVRIILLPLTYSSFKSQAKMKVLQPEMTEINEKFKEDPMKKQQEIMGLYRKAGVNPLGGCIPGLLQLPILIAMFQFFPSSIELRQQSFLWAEDLSTYDSIADLPFNIPFYGDHVSLFTLLMTLSTIIYTKVNMQMTAATNPQMKWMLYLMPVIFLGFFNNYSAGLSYYYFLSNVFGFGQQYIFKFFIDEDKIHAKIQENKKKPLKKSAWQQRIEEMAKARGMKPPAKR